MQLTDNKDINEIKQVAFLLEKENSNLHKTIHKLTIENAKLKGKTDGALQQELALMQEKLNKANRMIYGISSEKRVSDESKDKGKKKKKQKGHGPRSQPNLPIEEVIVKMDEADCICPICGEVHDEFENQFEEYDEVDVVERKFVIKRYKMQKYLCKKCDWMETALRPDRLIKGGRYSIVFAVMVAMAKYGDHLPLTRQVKQMERDGLKIDSQTLWDQIKALSKHLEPSYEAVSRYIQTKPVIGMDETRWQMMLKNNSKKWWVWVITCEDGVYYRILPNRATDSAYKIVKDYSGRIIVDGYSVYESLMKKMARNRDGPYILLSFCWAHVRRKIFDSEKSYPEAKEVIELIGKLYKVEADAKEIIDEKERLKYLKKMRQEKSKPVTKQIRDWMLNQRVMKKSKIGKAIKYTLKLWDKGLLSFLENPEISIDNNHTERSIRAVTIGRKNFYGSRSNQGAKTAGIFYTLIETAKLQGVDPSLYLKEAAIRAIQTPGTVTLPKDVIENQSI